MKRLMTACAALLFAGSAFAQVTVYSGVDADAGPNDPRPNSNAASADFEAAFPISPVIREDFEDEPNGKKSGDLGNGITLINDGNLGQGVRVSNSKVTGYNTTASGSKNYHFFADDGSITFSFDQPVQGFGAFFTGVGTSSGEIQLQFDDGSEQTVDLEGDDDGGVAFYGFVDPGKFITAVIVYQDEPGNDEIGIDDVAIVQSNNTARFRVTKDFSDNNAMGVKVTLECNTGQPLQQSDTIFDDGGDGTNFVLTWVSGDSASCEVTEDTVLSGYDVDLYSPNGINNECKWDNVQARQYVCEITNTAKDATYTVFKDWVLDGTGGDVIDAVADVTIRCNREITNGSNKIGNFWFKSADLKDNQSLVAKVDVETGPATCWASESILQSGVEESQSGACSNVSLSAGQSKSCTFTNTVFFEGIPTLSQWGMAIMVLLMLGVGFIGFRRIV